MKRTAKRPASPPAATGHGHYDQEWQFVGVDLHVESRQEMAPLLAALDMDFGTAWTRRGRHCLHGTGWAMLGVRRDPKDPSEGILHCARRLKALRGAAKAAWNRASVKELDIGIECGSEPTAAEWTVSAAALRAAVGIGAQIRITVYSYARAPFVPHQPTDAKPKPTPPRA